MAKVIVVGAGPVGLSAALWLKKNQNDVSIIDKKPAITELTKAIAVNSRTLELFESIDLAENMIAHGHKIHRMCFRYGDRQKFSIDFSELNHRYNFILAIPQATTESLLIEALASYDLKVSWNQKLIECKQQANSVKVLLQQADLYHTKYYDYCLGADGAHSTIRKDQGFEFQGKMYPDEWSLVDLMMDWPYSENEANIWFFNSGIVLFVMPLGQQQFRMVANTNNALEYLPTYIQINKISWQSNFKVECRQTKSFQSGWVFLAGDSAHVHSPAGGRGMNLGIEDAYQFANHLAQDELAIYNTNRYRKAKRVLTDTDLMFRIAKLKNPFLRYMRNHVLFNLMTQRIITQKMLCRMAGL